MRTKSAGAVVRLLPNSEDSQKTCIKCGTPKFLRDFAKSKRCLDGHRNVCRECHNSRRRGSKLVAAWQHKYGTTPAGRYRKARWLAHERGFEFELTFEQYSALISQPCYYCHDRFGEFVKRGVGLDRLNSNIGYILGNVVSSCGRCNRLKSDWMSPEEAQAVVDIILKMRGLK